MWRTVGRLAAGLGGLTAASSRAWLIIALVAGVLVLVMSVVILTAVFAGSERREAALATLRAIMRRRD